MASSIDPSAPADGQNVAKSQLRANFLSAHDEIESLQAALIEAHSIKFLLSDQDQTIDVANAPYGPYRFGAGWTESRTITLTGNPPAGAFFRFSNNSDFDHYLANDGVYNPLDLPILPFKLERGGTIDLECYDGTSKLIKFERAQEQSSSRFPPFGGGQYTILMKNTASDHDFAWKDMDDVPEALPNAASDWVMFFKPGFGHRKARLIHQGIGSSRPSAVAVGAGAQWFDTNLRQPIWSNGTAWVDANGNPI